MAAPAVVRVRSSNCRPSTAGSAVLIVAHHTAPAVGNRGARQRAPESIQLNACENPDQTPAVRRLRGRGGSEKEELCENPDQTPAVRRWEHGFSPLI